MKPTIDPEEVRRACDEQEKWDKSEPLTYGKAVRVVLIDAAREWLRMQEQGAARCCCGHVNVIGGEIIDPGPCPIHDQPAPDVQAQNDVYEVTKMVKVAGMSEVEIVELRLRYDRLVKAANRVSTEYEKIRRTHSNLERLPVQLKLWLDDLAQEII